MLWWELFVFDPLYCLVCRRCCSLSLSISLTFYDLPSFLLIWMTCQKINVQGWVHGHHLMRQSRRQLEPGFHSVSGTSGLPECLIHSELLVVKRYCCSGHVSVPCLDSSFLGRCWDRWGSLLQTWDCTARLGCLSNPRRVSAYHHWALCVNVTVLTVTSKWGMALQYLMDITNHKNSEADCGKAETSRFPPKCDITVDAKDHRQAPICLQHSHNTTSSIPSRYTLVECYQDAIVPSFRTCAWLQCL